MQVTIRSFLRATRLAFLALLVAGLTPARGEMWTNQAGHVIEARLGEFDGVWVTLERTNGSALRLPLSALREPDQRRVRLLKGQTVAPAFVQAAYRDAVTILERFERLPAAQQTAEGWKQAANLACATFDARIQARATELTNAVVLAEVQRLRVALAQGGKENISGTRDPRAGPVKRAGSPAAPSATP